MNGDAGKALAKIYISVSKDFEIIYYLITETNI